jgi:hypothetical protein
MKQFFETYHVDEKLAPLVRVLFWSHNLLRLTEHSPVFLRVDVPSSEAATVLRNLTSRHRNLYRRFVFPQLSHPLPIK